MEELQRQGEQIAEKVKVDNAADQSVFHVPEARSSWVLSYSCRLRA